MSAARKKHLAGGHDDAASRIVIAGLGRTGLSCARYLSARGEEVVVTDTRTSPPGEAELHAALPDVETRLGGLDEALLAGAAQVIVSPGLSLAEPFVSAARDRGIPVLGDIELFACAAAAPVIAITGSNGKSTVTTLVADMLAAAGRRVLAGGNLGEPALELLAQPPPDYYVLELSSFQLERTYSLQPLVAVLLNVTPDHMDRYASVGEYAAAKARVFMNAEQAVVNREDPRVLRLAAGCAHRVSFGLDEPGPDDCGLVGTGAQAVLTAGGEQVLPVCELPMLGRHNVMNALAALAVAKLLGIPMAACAGVLRAFRPLPHRMTPVAQSAGVTWIDDSKATNVGAAVAAIEGLDQPVILIAGGLAKGADFSALAAALARRARGAIVMGEAAAALEQALAGICPVFAVGDMDEAVGTAARLARAGDAVLLAPACASQDMYADYAARGRAFADAVGRQAQ